MIAWIAFLILPLSPLISMQIFATRLIFCDINIDSATDFKVINGVEIE